MRRVLVGIAAVSLAADLAGCSGGDDAIEDSPTQPAGAEATSEATGGDTSGADSGDGTPKDADLAAHEFATSAQDAIDAAAQEAGEGTVHAIEIDWEDDHNAWVWTVTTLVDGTDHEVDINADTGEIVETEEDSTNDKEKAIDLNDPMTFEEARDKALEVRDGRITEWSYSWDDNRLEYQFDIEQNGDSEEVAVNADTGEVTED